MIQFPWNVAKTQESKQIFKRVNFWILFQRMKFYEGLLMRSLAA
jgi:hypothetical protein